jgi:hypothetical protein
MKKSSKLLSFGLCVMIVMWLMASGGAAQITLTHTRSPDGRSVIIAEGSADIPQALYFADANTGALLGWIMHHEEAGASNVRLKTRWNPSGSEVAILTSYGAKMSDIEIYRQGSDGRFTRVEFKKPDPLAFFAEEKPTLFSNADRLAAPENELGSWKSENRVTLLIGEALLKSDNSMIHVYVSFNVSVLNAPTVKEARFFGPFTDAESETFLREWRKSN